MLELSSEDDVFSFKHGGRGYEIPAVTVDDVEALGEWIKKPHAEMTRGVRDYMVELCREEYPDTADLISRVGLKNFFLIFRTWSGFSLGESSTSDDS